MNPWLAHHLWAQVLIVSAYCGGFVIAGRWAAKPNDPTGAWGSPPDSPVANVLIALLGGIFVPLLALPVLLCWAINRLLTMGQKS